MQIIKNSSYRIITLKPTRVTSMFHTKPPSVPWGKIWGKKGGGGDLERTGILNRIPFLQKMTSSDFNLKKGGGDLVRNIW